MQYDRYPRDRKRLEGVSASQLFTFPHQTLRLCFSQLSPFSLSFHCQENCCIKRELFHTKTWMLPWLWSCLYSCIEREWSQVCFKSIKAGHRLHQKSLTVSLGVASIQLLRFLLFCFVPCCFFAPRYIVFDFWDSSFPGENSTSQKCLRFHWKGQWSATHISWAWPQTGIYFSCTADMKKKKKVVCLLLLFLHQATRKIDLWSGDICDS